jgi:hypothetical protein
MLYRILFLLIVLAYCLCYAPFGINETDGGFLTALAWQLEQGKALYRDVVYVRPPLPVWERYLELQLLPDQWAVLAERWLFYLKAALYSWLGAAVLTAGSRQSILAIAGFIVSVHCYPAAAWHTVDGILWAVLAVWCFYRNRTWADVAGGVALAAALLCKQSFYPLALLLPLLMYGAPVRRWLRGGMGFAATLSSTAVVLAMQGAWSDYWVQTAGAGTLGQLIQHGLTDYLRLQPVAVLPAGILLLPVAHRLWGQRQNSRSKVPLIFWAAALCWLAGTYVLKIQERQAFTLAYAQMRFLFWLSAGHLLLEWGRGKASWIALRFPVALLLVAWSSALSWGYNLPVLFAVPMVWTVVQVSERLWEVAYGQTDTARIRNWLQLGILAGLLGMYRFSYEFVYRDGRRAQMTASLAVVFPRLQGIYTTGEHWELYADLRRLSQKYPIFKTLPSFPSANYLCDTAPLLPLDWVVEREMGSAREKVRDAADRMRPVWFVEKTYANRLAEDEQLIFTREILKKEHILEETSHFWVISSGE